MNALDIATRSLAAVGGINWGLVALREFDLVAKLTGNDFGRTNAASRTIYGAVGLAAGYQLARLAQRA